MANRGAKVQPIKQRPIKTTWLKNALSAVGSSSRSVLGEYAPTVTGAVKTGADFARTMSTSVRGTRRGSMGTNLNQNKYVKLANTAFKNALDDLKSGHLAGNENRMMNSFMSDNGFDDLFDSSGGSGVSFGDEGGGNVTINNVNAAGSAEAFTSLNSSISKQTELTLRTSKAQTDAYVSMASAQFFQSQQIGGQVLEHLSAMNQNLAALVEYNSTNMNKFIESSLAFYDKVGQNMTKKESESEDKDDIDINKVIGANGGFDVGAYKKYVTKRLKENLSNSDLGMLASIMDDNALNALAADPLGMASKMVVQYAVPEVISSTIKGMDQAISGAMPLMMKKLYDWGEKQGNDWFGKITGTLAKSFGYRAERTNFIDRKRDIEVKTGAIPFDGETKLAITNTITKELGSQTQYLKFIAERMGGTSDGAIASNKKKLSSYLGKREMFDFDEHKYVTMEQHNDELLKGIQKSIADGFNNSAFGKNLTAAVNSIQDEKVRADAQSLQQQIYLMLDRNSANGNMDFSFKNGKASKALRNAVKRMNGSKAAKNTLNNIFDQMAIDDPLAANTFAQGQIFATANRNKKIEEYRKNPTQSGILQSDLFEQIGPDGKVISIDTLLKNRAEKNAAGSRAGRFARKQDVNYRNAVNNDSFANGDMMAFSDQLRKASMQHISNMGNAFASGNSQALMQEAGAMIGGVATTIVSSIDNKLLKPMAAKLFGTKDNDGFRRGGALSSMTNMLHDSMLEMQHRFTGKAYVDSEGRTHEKSKTSIIGTVKEGIMEKIFGKKDEETGERERKGIFTGITDSIKQSFADWHNAMFGDTDKNGAAVTKDNVMKLMEDSLKKKLPDAMVGGVAGGAAGLVSGGLLGAMIGGPIGGVILGSAVGFAHKSDKFQKFIFGDQDKDNGLITKKTQEFVSKNKNALIGGAAIGGLKGAITGGGFLGTLVGGPVAGALLGMAATTAFKSKAFHDFLFGDEKRGSIGVINSFKNVFSHIKDKNKDEAGLSLTGKTVGMGATGAAAGALTASLLSQIGFMPAMLTAGGPIGGAVVGLGLAIKAQSDTFSRWLFGNRKDKNDADYKAGVIGQLGNTLQAYVVQPFKHTVQDIADDMRITFKYNILGTIENAIQPIGEAAADMAFWVKKRATGIFNFVGDAIRDKIADPFVSLIKTTLIKPFATLGQNAAKLSYNVAKQAVLLPFRVLNGITHAIVSPIRKVLHPVKFAKRMMNVIMTGFERATGLSLDPIRKASEIVGEGMKKGVKGLITAPFNIVGGIVGAAGSAVGAANNALEDIDQRRNMKKMEKAGLFNDNVLYEKYKKDKNKGDKSYKDWKAEYVRGRNKSGYDYSERLKTTYERLSAQGKLEANEDGSMPSFDEWKEKYMRSDFKARWKIQKVNEAGERADAKVASRERRNRDKNQKAILKYTGGNQWEDTVQNRAEAEAKAGKKIRWRGDAIDSEEQKRKSEEIKDAAAYDDKKLANLDPKKSSNAMRQLSILQQILNVIKGLNPDGSDPKHPNLFSNNFNGDNKSGRNDNYDGAGLANANTIASDILRAGELSEDAVSMSRGFTSFTDHSSATVFGNNARNEEYSGAGLDESKSGFFSRIFGRKSKNKNDAGMSDETARAYESILNNASGRGYEEGTDNAEEGYSIVGEAGRPEIVWTNKGDKVYSDKRKPLRVEIADFARSAVSKFVKYIRNAVGGGGNATPGDAIPTMGGSQGLLSGPTMDATPAGLPGPSDTRIAANAYSLIDDGEPAENNATTGYTGEFPLAIMNSNSSGEGAQTDVQFNAPSILTNPQMAIVRGKQELRDKTLDAALTADEAMAAKEADRKESRMNRIMEAVENMAGKTNEQVGKTTDFFKGWSEIFGKKGLIGAGLIALIAFLKKTGLLKKLLEFLGSGIGTAGQAISDAINQMQEDSEWQDKNKANTNGKSGSEEFGGFMNDLTELFGGDVLGYLTNDEGYADHSTYAKTKLLYKLAKKPVQIMYGIGKGLAKGGAAVARGIGKGVSKVGKGVGTILGKTVGRTRLGRTVKNAGSSLMRTLGSFKGAYNSGRTLSNPLEFGSARADKFLNNGYTAGGSAEVILPDAEPKAEPSWFADMSGAADNVADNVADATVSKGGTATSKAGNVIAEEISDAEFKAAVKGGGSAPVEIVIDSAGNIIDDGVEAGAKQFDNIASHVMTGSSQPLALPGPTLKPAQPVLALPGPVSTTQPVLALPGPTLDTAADATAHMASSNADDIIDGTAKIISSQADDAVESGAKLVMQSADEVADKSTKKLKDKIIDMLQAFFQKVGSKVGSAEATKGKLADSWIGKIMSKITKAFSKEGVFGKIASKVSKVLGAKVTVAGMTLGLSEVAFVTLGALNGISGTARLFQVNKNKVDGTMKIISAAFGGFTQTTPGAVVDIVNEVISATCGFDILNTAACMIYELIKGKENYDKLQDDRNSFKKEYVSDRNKELKKQYNTLKKAGLTDGKYENANDYIKAVEDGTVKANYKSFQDYNSDKNASFMEKGTKKVVDAVKKPASAISKWWNGTDEQEEGFIGKSGNRYTKNKDGSYTVTDKDGNTIGTIGDESNFQDDIAGSFKNQGKQTKGAKQKISKAGKDLKKAASNVTKSIGKAASNVAKDAMAFGGRVAKSAKNAWDFFHKRDKKIDSVWMLKDGTGCFYDDTGVMYNADGEKTGKTISPSDITDLYRAGLLTPARWESKTGFEKWQDNLLGNIKSGLSKVGSAAMAAGKHVLEVGSAWLGKVKKGGEKFLRVAAGIPLIAVNMVTSHKTYKYIDPSDNTYYMMDSTGSIVAGKTKWMHYAANGDPIGEADYDTIETLYESGMLKREEVRTSGLQEAWTHQAMPALRKGWKTVSSAVVNGAKAAGEFAEKAFEGAADKYKKWRNWQGRNCNAIASFFVGKKEVRFLADDQTYYVKAKYGYTHYNKMGDIIEDNIPDDQIDPMIENGLLKQTEYTAPSGISKIGHSMKEGATKVLGFFQDGVVKAGEMLENFGISAQRFWNSVNRYGLIHTIGNIFKQQVSMGYVEPTGNYYKRKGTKWEYYSQTGDLLDSGITDEEVEAKLQAGLITPHKIVEDSPAKKAVDDIQKAAKDAWEKAKNVVTGGWAKFTNWLTGGSGKGKPKTRGSGGGFGYNIGSFDEKEFGELPQFADVSAGGSGEGSKGNIFKRAIQMRRAMDHGFGSGPRRMGGGFGKSKVGNAAPDTVNGHSYYAQTDKRWARDRYDYNGDGGTLGDSGCGPAAMSMVVADMAGTNVDPRKMAVLAQETGTRDNTGTNWNFVSGAADTFGLHSEQRYSPSANFISDSLRRGNEVVLSGTSNGQGTPYTNAGHYVVAVGQDSDGRIRVNDPRGKSFSRAYTPQELVKYTGSAWSIGNGGSGSRRRAYNHYRKGGYGKDDTTNYAGDSADRLNDFPYLLQNDSRWGSLPYTSTGNPSQTIGSSSCGPTSMAIVLRSFGVDITPKETCQFALDNGMRTANSGTSWDFFPAIGKKYGLTTEELGVSESGILNALKNAKPVIASMGPPTFTSGGHYIDLVGIKDGKIVVNDCASKERSMVTYSPSVFTSEGSNFWAFSKNGKGSIGNVATLGSLSGTNTNGTEASVTEGSPIDKIGNFFGEVANRALEGALTGNWNTDFTSFWNPSTGTTDTSSTTASTTTTSSGNLQGNEVTEQVYNYLTTTGGMTPFGAAGLMGNLEAESGINPGIVEGILAKKLGTTSAQYTADVDSGKISKNDFLHPLGKQYGYGLAQWTSPGRKQGLYDLVKSRNASIADTKSQLDWLLQELQSSSYSPVYNALKSATSVKEASDVVLHKFEAPADQSGAVEQKRASMGQNWYNKYAGAAGKGGFGVKFLRTLNKVMGGKGGINTILNRLRGGKGSTAADAREALVNWILCIVGRNEYTRSGARTRVMDGVDGHGYGDCSSTCCAIYETALGMNIGTYTGDMPGKGKTILTNSTIGTYPDESKMLPGDLIFFYEHGSSGEDGHVEMYVGCGQMCGHGSNTGPKVKSIKTNTDWRTNNGYGTWSSVVRYVEDGQTYNVNEPDKSKLKQQNTYTDGKGNSADGANTGASNVTTSTGSSDATTTTTGGQEGNSAIDKIGNFFSEVANRAVEGTLTGNWNTDFNSFWNGTTTTTGGDATSSSSTIPGNFPKYTFNDEQKKYIAQIMMRENGGENLAITKDGASHMANLSEVQFGHPATAESLVNMIKTSGWFGAGGGSIPAYAQNPNQNVYDAISQVLEQGNRTLPRYVTEYDMFPLDAAISGHWYNGRNGENQSDYVKHKTLITQNSSRGLNAKYTFYKFFGDDCKVGDVSGYYEQYYQKYKDDDPRPDGVTPDPGGSGVGVRRKNRLSDPEILRKIHIIGGQGGAGDDTTTQQEPEVYAPTKAQINNRMLARARLMEKRSKSYQNYLDRVQKRENLKHGGHGVTTTSNTGFINANTTTYGGTNYTSSSTLSEIMSRADAARSGNNDSELLRCMIEILAIIADNTGKGVSGLSQANELLAKLKTGGTNVVVNKGSDTPVVTTLKQEGSKPTKNMKLAQQIAAGK